MSDTELNSSDAMDPSGGGAATANGILFQQRLGAFFAAAILSGARLDARLGLTDASPTWLRFETEAPVDDLLVGTSNDGFIAIQAKTAASLSAEPRSPFGKTVEQFVRHWYTCLHGDGSLGWNRPLDPVKDRLVFAVGPQTSAPVRLDLPKALQLISQPGGYRLTAGQQRALEVFEECVQNAWGKVTAAPFDSTIIQPLARLIVVLPIERADLVAASAALANVIGPDQDEHAALTGLSEICEELMTRRGGGDLVTFRQLLATRGVGLAAPTRYQSDIAALRRHSEMVAQSLTQYEVIEAETGVPVNIERDCQTAVEAAASAESLLIIGEPGAGKSAVLNALARSLRARGDDVLELAVDRYSIETLEGLARELRLEHGILDVLDAWEGPGPGWLIIDALDATRGGRGEGVFRALIEGVFERAGRWRVVASIRSFDLRMGQRLRQLFKGKPPIEGLTDPAFANVRHVEIPRWSDAEFNRLLEGTPALSSVLENATPRLRDLAKVPFNTRLLSELVAEGSVKSSLNDVSSQVELLTLFWQHRIEVHGLVAETCLRQLVEAMVEARALRAPAITSSADSVMIDTLCREGVLIRVEGNRWIQFRHHILFDFAAARVFLEPSSLVSGTLRFPKQDALGLMLTPALSFVLEEIWNSETNHARFWTAIGRLVSDQGNDPIVRSAASRIGAVHPVEAHDVLWLAERIAADDDLAIATASHVSGALAVRVEDESAIELAPWAEFAAALAPNASKVSGTLRFLLHLLTERVREKRLREGIGRAARALLAYGLSMSDPGIIVRTAIAFVAETYGTNSVESRALLQRLFIPERLQAFAAEEVPALCYKIDAIGDIDPEFTAEVFAHVYAFGVIENRETQLGDSQILPLRSNARQDYDMARYSLSEYFPDFLERHPKEAVDAITNAVEGYVAREHPLKDSRDYRLTIKGHLIRVREDYSYIWAHDPESTYSRDAEILLVKLVARLRAASESDCRELIRLLCTTASLAVFWARLFMATSERDGDLLNELWPFAASVEPFLMLSDTRKDAIDVIAKGFTQRPEDERIKLEQAALALDFSGYTYPTEARAEVLRRLFTAIGYENLRTEAARAEMASIPKEGLEANEREFVIGAASITATEPYYWITDLDRENPSNVAIIAAIEEAKAALSLEVNDKTTQDLTFEKIITVLAPLRAALRGLDIHPNLRTVGEGVIGQACNKIIELKLLSLKSAVVPVDDPAPRFLELLHISARSTAPKVGETTEADFERSASWASPAPRVEAAQAFFDLFIQRPDLYTELQTDIELLLADPHPAVRLQAGLRLVRFSKIDPDGFWQRLVERLEHESNLGVLERLISGVLGHFLFTAPQRTFNIIQNLLRREENNPERIKRIRNVVCDELSFLWVTCGLNDAKEVLQNWMAQSESYSSELQRIVRTLGRTVVTGLSDLDDENAQVRVRALALLSSIIDTANAKMAEYHARAESSASQVEDARHNVELIDTACQTLVFATPKSPAGADLSEQERFALTRFFNESADLLERIGEYATPHTTYYLMQFLERMISVDPARVFDITAHFLRCGTRYGYQHESMGVDLLVQMIGIFLADYKEIFEVEARRLILIDSLEIFMDAGWPAARRLLYRLPELIQ
ncbi:hypothetical protein SAMN05428966_117104 [Massilia sp. PDC64]|nr:ATP-binding protein [Massilia sp. PDC64]SDF59376.1 hypothetical protein SAMN05428966_117104 [Massilia sp. PDC64]